MNSIWRRVRGAIGLGLLWAAGGAIVGGLIELILNLLPGPDLFLGVDIWPAALAVPAFFAGLAFSVVLAVVEGRRSFEELKLSRLGVWGAVGGVLLGVAVGLPVVGVAVLALTSGASAAGSLALARGGRQPELLGEGSRARNPDGPADGGA
jgi:polyferredoxin